MAGINEDPGYKWLLFSPSGRIGRQAYVMSILLWLMLQGAAVFLMLAFENTSKAGLLLTALALVIISVATFISFILLSIKRLHDVGFLGFSCCCCSFRSSVSLCLSFSSAGRQPRRMISVNTPIARNDSGFFRDRIGPIHYRFRT